MMKMLLSEVCEKYMDGLYDSRLPEESQCSGYKLLKEFIESGVEPASKSETDRWLSSPTTKELCSAPELKYMRFLHPVLRVYVLENWDSIKNLKTK